MSKDIKKTNRELLRAQWRTRDLALRALGYEDYASYLASAHWRGLTSALRATRCCRCGSGTRLALHHVTYERLGRESPHDMRTLCHACHEMLHDYARRGLCSLDPATLPAEAKMIRGSKKADKRARKAARPERDKRRFTFLNFPCSTCGARIGEVCRVPSGAARKSHAARRSSPIASQPASRDRRVEQEPEQASRDDLIKRARRSAFPLQTMKDLRDEGLI